jgi:hypothetical protein
MHKGVIAVQAANKLIADEYLQVATGERDTYAGFLIPSVDGLMKAAIRASDPHNSAAELMQVIKDTNEQLKAEDRTKDKPLVLYLAATDCTHEDDLQPHVLLKNDKNETQLAVFLEGEFEEEFEGLSEQSPVHHSPEFFAAQTYLVGKVSDIHQRTKSLEETIKELKQPNVYKEIVKSLRKDSTSRMVATFVASNGDIFSIKQNDKEKVFSWGYVSQAFGYEEKQTAAPVVPSKSVFAQPTAPAPTAPKPADPPFDITNTPDKTSVPTIPLKEDELTQWKGVLFVPGPSVEKKRHTLKNMYKHWGGDQILTELTKTVDTNGTWHDGTARFKVREKMWKEIPKALEEGRLVRWSPEAAVGNVGNASVKPITQDAPAVITSTSDDKPTAIHMIMKPEERQKIEVLLPRVVSARDEKGQLILNPEKLGEYEKNIPTLAEQLGKPAGTFLPLDPEGYDLIEAINPGATKRLFFENQAILAALQKRVAELDKKPASKSAFAA